MTYCILLVLLSTAPLILLPQNAAIDSLKQVVKNSKADTTRAHALCRLCEALRKNGSHEEAQQAAKQGLDLSRKTGAQEIEGVCLNSLGNAHWSAGQLPQALARYQQYIDLQKQLGSESGIALGLNSLGYVYDSQGDFVRALDCFKRSLSIYDRIGDQAGQAKNCISVGNVLLSQGDSPQAIRYFQRSAKLYEKYGDRAGMATAYGSIGIVYFDQEEWKKSKDWLERGLENYTAVGDKSGMTICLLNIANSYENLGQIERANELNLRCYDLFKELGHSNGVATCLVNLGSGMSKKKRYSDALKNFREAQMIFEQISDRASIAANNGNISSALLQLGKLDSARTYAQMGLKLADEIGHLSYKASVSHALYQADSALGDWKSAFTSLRLFKLYSDSLKNDERSHELGRLESKAEYDKQAEIDRLKAEEDRLRQRERFNWMLGSAAGGLLLLAVIAFTLFRGRQKEKKANAALKTLNEEIQQQKAEIEAMNAELQATLSEISEQKHQIEEQHSKIEDSIRYASRIQHAILPSEAQLAESLPGHFIHYQPRDIVSGDFYWLARNADRTFFAVVDCTGHGVPGAFMSVLGSNLLHQIVDENKIAEPDVILAELDRRISQTLRQQFGGDSKDGMDLALLVIHQADASGRHAVEYAGAGRPLWVWSQGELTEYHSAKYSCGGSQHEDKTYPARRLSVQSGDRLFVFSDGVVDQFGGDAGRKLGSKRLQAFLSETATLPIEKQGAAFAAFFAEWMKMKKQLDDVLIAGMAV